MSKESLATGTWNHIKGNGIIYGSAMIGGIGGAAYGYSGSDGSLKKAAMYGAGGLAGGAGIGFGLSKYKRSPSEEVAASAAAPEVKPSAGWATPNYEGANKWKGDVRNYQPNSNKDVAYYNETQLPQLVKRYGLLNNELDAKIKTLESQHAAAIAEFGPI